MFPRQQSSFCGRCFVAVHVPSHDIMSQSLLRQKRLLPIKRKQRMLNVIAVNECGAAAIIRSLNIEYSVPIVVR